jgi:hypothetical protein
MKNTTLASVSGPFANDSSSKTAFSMRHTLILAIAFAVTAAHAASTAPGSAQIAVDATKVLAPVSPYIFGQALEAADSAGIFKGSVTQPTQLQSGNGFWNWETAKPVASIVQKCHQLNVGMLRYPGGSLASGAYRRPSGMEIRTRGIRSPLPGHRS